MFGLLLVNEMSSNTVRAVRHKYAFSKEEMAELKLITSGCMLILDIASTKLIDLCHWPPFATEFNPALKQNSFCWTLIVRIAAKSADARCHICDLVYDEMRSVKCLGSTLMLPSHCSKSKPVTIILALSLSSVVRIDLKLPIPSSIRYPRAQTPSNCQYQCHWMNETVRTEFLKVAAMP